MLGMRPDVAYVVIKLSQFSANPSQIHLDKALYIMRYLVGTQDYKIVYNGKVTEGLMAFTDSDWAADKTKHCSTTGYFAVLARGSVRTEVLSLGPQGQRQPRAGIAKGRLDQKGSVCPTKVVEYEIP